VRAITFRAAPDVLARVVRRDGGRRAADRSHMPPLDRQHIRTPTKRETTMKTMTCRPSEALRFEHHGESADDVINAQDRHLKEAEKAGDAPTRRPATP
jgi:hypothetical protein